MGASPEKSVNLPYIRRRPRFLRKAAWGVGHHYYKHILPHPIRPDRLVRPDAGAGKLQR
ncbi:hypothetical protein [Alloprevotella tannerae]